MAQVSVTAPKRLLRDVMIFVVGYAGGLLSSGRPTISVSSNDDTVCLRPVSPSPASTTTAMIQTPKSIPEDLIHWKLSGAETMNKTVCSTRTSTAPAGVVRDLFRPFGEWQFTRESSRSPRVCRDSLVRVLWDWKGLRRARSSVNLHKEGQQLTSSIVGGSVEKSILYELIRNERDDEDESIRLLQDSLPVTRVFNSPQECKDFCSGEWLQTTMGTDKPQKWIWKPKRSSMGRGIRLIGGDGHGGMISCVAHCNKEGGNTQAQLLTAAMTLPDGRKFDVRSHVLVANLDPLIVFTGGEKLRICMEALSNPNPVPFPHLPPETPFNPFQHVCNTHVGGKHPNWNRTDNVDTISRGFPVTSTQERVKKKLDDVNRALVKLLRDRWSGRVGMFQMFGVDFLVDDEETLWLLEINSQPGFPSRDDLSRRIWRDVLTIEWEILSAYALDQNSSEWLPKVEEKFSGMEWEELRRLDLI